MLQVLSKADQRRRAERTLALVTRALHVAFLAFVRDASVVPKPIMDLIERRDIQGVLEYVDLHVAAFGNSLTTAFIDVASAETAEFGRRLVRKATPSIGISFDASDPQSADIMRRNRLRLVTGLSRQQRDATRNVLVAGLRQGLSTAQMARQLRSSIGLTTRQQQQITTFELAQRVMRQQDLELPEIDRGPIFSDGHIERLVDRKRDQLIAMRATTIARTEALKVTSLATEQALRQSLEQTGTPTNLVGREWQSTHDDRTRDDHANADGQRRALGMPFNVGGEQLMRPGDGSAANSINCRCVLTYFFADTPEQLQAWLSEGT